MFLFCLAKEPFRLIMRRRLCIKGEVPERSNGLPWKGSISETVSGVRIPPSPHLKIRREIGVIFLCGESDMSAHIAWGDSTS